MFYNSSENADIVGMLVKKNSFANLKTATHGNVSGPRGLEFETLDLISI